MSKNTSAQKLGWSKFWVKWLENPRNSSDLCQATESVDSKSEQPEQEEAQRSVEEVAEVRDNGELLVEFQIRCACKVRNQLATYLGPSSALYWMISGFVLASLKPWSE